uniref:Uncharacterized protein n=1 Tax=Rhizophora mucronata TaxID=61149 RepID=A0A2P2IR66_RHIMU
MSSNLVLRQLLVTRTLAVCPLIAQVLVLLLKVFDVLNRQI